MKRALLSLFGVGYLPGAPGTFASGVAILLYSCMLLVTDVRMASVAGAVLALVFGTVTVLGGRKAEGEGGVRDPGWIVSDEVAGQFVAAFLATWPWEVLAGFLGFRLLDVAKPFPISRLERLSGGWGILADDLAAGLAVCGALRLAAWLAPMCGLAGA